MGPACWVLVTVLNICKLDLNQYEVGKTIYWLSFLVKFQWSNYCCLSFLNYKINGKTHLSEIIYCQSYGNDGHDYDGKSIFLIIFTKP